MPQRMALSDELLRIYRDADYVVFGDRRLVLRVGERNAEFDELLHAEGKTSAAFITAANPRGEKRSDVENGVANAALQSCVAGAGYAHYRGEGREPSGGWSEPSLLVIGISRANAAALARRFEQNAIVFCELGRAAELVVCEKSIAPDGDQM
jgi:hypothetical protein